MPINYNVLDNQFRWRPAAGGLGARTKNLPEAASSNFRYGEPVVLSSGSVTQIATIPSALAISSSLAAGDLIYGWALGNSNGTTGNIVPILLAEGVEVLIRVYNATAASAEAQDVAVGDLAELFRYNPDSGNLGVFAVISDAPNGTDGINKMVIVEKYNEDRTGTNVQLVGEQVAGDDYGLVWAKVRSSLVATNR